MTTRHPSGHLGRCNARPEPRVRYSRQTDRYHALVACGCGHAVAWQDEHGLDRYADAERLANLMVQKNAG